MPGRRRPSRRRGCVALRRCHQTVLRRTAERISKINETIAAAIDAGVLKSFNSTYRARRLQAKQRGEPFLSYSEALRRLRSVGARSVARGKIPGSFTAVFEDPGTKTNPQYDCARCRSREGYTPHAPSPRIAQTDQVGELARLAPGAHAFAAGRVCQDKIAPW